MKKIYLFTKLNFHFFNVILIIFYLYPGSILGWLIHKDFKKQPSITTDFVISSNHFYVFFILSILGLISYNRIQRKMLFIYLFTISIILELFHKIIPNRSFEFSDLFGNLFGVILVFIFYQFFKIQK